MFFGNYIRYRRFPSEDFVVAFALILKKPFNKRTLIVILVLLYVCLVGQRREGNSNLVVYRRGRSSEPDMRKKKCWKDRPNNAY